MDVTGVLRPSAAAAALALCAEAGAAELRVGVMAHNVAIVDAKNADKEGGPNLEAEFVFASPDVLEWAFSPRPYVMGSLNLAGDTSFAGVGLNWRWAFARGWALEPGLGYVLHDGEISNPYPDGSPEALAFADDHVLLGSRDLFRTSLALSRDFGAHWAGQLFFEHLSHGQILGQGRNQGLDEVGVRAAYRFGR